MSRHVQIIFQNALNWSKWNCSHATNFTYSDSVFNSKFFTCFTFSSLFACHWISQTFDIFSWGCTILELGKPFKHLHSPHFLLSKSYSHHFKTSSSISSSVCSKICCRHVAVSRLPFSRHM